MDRIWEFVGEVFRRLYNVPELIRLGGMGGLILVVFCETGLMVGFFLPGDSLLVTAGLFAARGDLDIIYLNLALMAAAVIGDATGYLIGYRLGKALYRRPDSLLFRREHLLKTQRFYERHGGKTIIIARFMPIVRTFAPVVAGAGEMTYRRFAAYNVVGGVAWVASMTLTGYYLARAVPDLEKHIHVVVAVVIFLSLLPGIIAWLRERLQPKPSAGPASPADKSHL
ncbi:MAG TPA: VTT domain-containing protein [Vicinamibacteria bacterium]|nr:VTT domain-containing protein [Vicinamibacteria bacterium]